ncbi:MAG: sensor histidine kinase, partial [Croceimicrobium sp.]
SYLELRLDKFLNDWIKGREAKSTQLKIKNQQLQIANLSMLYDLIPQLAESESESLIIEKTRDLLQMFFAPKEVVCYRTQDGVGQLVGGKSDDFDFESFLNRIKEQRNHEVDVVGDGFIYHVSYQEHSLVYFAVQELAFPGNIRDYLEVLSLLSNYLSLFIARAREHDRGLDLQNEILERDKSIIKKNEELAEAVNTKDKFFSILAHDLRSPFNAMLGFSELLQEDYANLTDNERLEYIGIVSESLKGSFALLNDLLEWSRAQRGALTFKPKVSLLQNIFNASKEELDKVAIQKGVNLTFNTADDLEIYGDFNMMRTILRNIISNAIKFCSSGQNIHVKGYSKEGNQVISIKDEGVGMSSQQLDSLFNVAQTKSTIGTSGEKGSGLGLILCKEFMDVHKGEIQVSSQEGQGSEFLLFFPGSISS